ncbi:hypothetical protein ACVBEG_27020 [Pseudomonas sp. GG8]
MKQITHLNAGSSPGKHHFQQPYGEIFLEQWTRTNALGRIYSSINHIIPKDLWEQ